MAAKGMPKSGGRKKGSGNKRKAALAKVAGPIKVHVTPLEFMLNVMAGTAIPKQAPPAVKAQLIALQFDAAKAAAPYCHARLAAFVPPPAPTGEQLSVASTEVRQLEPEQRSILEIGRRLAYALNMAAQAAGH